MFFLPVDPRDKSHKDPDTIDLSKPRHAQYKHKAWKRHQDAVYWVDIDLAIRKGLTFYQTRSNAVVLADEDHTYHMSEAEYFHYMQKLVDHSQKVRKQHPTIEKTF